MGQDGVTGLKLGMGIGVAIEFELAFTRADRYAGCGALIIAQ